MFTRISESPNRGFQPSRRLLRLLELSQRVDDMLMFYTVAAALLLSMAVIPAYAAVYAQPDTVLPGTTLSEAFPRDTTIHVCSGRSWGDETVECLLAIDAESGRTPRDIRVVGRQAAPIGL